jgi:hypothetical protein
VTQDKHQIPSAKFQLVNEALNIKFQREVCGKFQTPNSKKKKVALKNRISKGGINLIMIS